ncbi:MAG: type II toxin-antitoxin system Phd/YefM family antitoxin [Treponema sp.]|nr:type II toxin-antitoxin system Phd/YefM family antitoxin [Treponema sp.]
MKFITVRDFRSSSASIWKSLPKEQEMIITNNGKPIALLTPLSDRNLEETLSTIRRAKAIDAVKMIQQESIKNKTNIITMEEINNEIEISRKKMKVILDTNIIVTAKEFILVTGGMFPNN